jgi:hypothetical protein
MQNLRDLMSDLTERGKIISTTAAACDNVFLELPTVLERRVELPEKARELSASKEFLTPQKHFLEPFDVITNTNILEPTAKKPRLTRTTEADASIAPYLGSNFTIGPLELRACYHTLDDEMHVSSADNNPDSNNADFSEVFGNL